jgi:hypothetical protein
MDARNGTQNSTVIVVERNSEGRRLYTVDYQFGTVGLGRQYAR